MTCLAVDSCGWYLISGSKDSTSIIWDIGQVTHAPKPYQLLHGHDEPITCVSIATELDMAVSGSSVSENDPRKRVPLLPTACNLIVWLQDGTVNVYTIQEGYLVHTLIPEGCVSPIVNISFVTVSVQGHIVFSASDKVQFSRGTRTYDADADGEDFIVILPCSRSIIRFTFIA